MDFFPFDFRKINLYRHSCRIEPSGPNNLLSETKFLSSRAFQASAPLEDQSMRLLKSWSVLYWKTDTFKRQGRLAGQIPYAKQFVDNGDGNITQQFKNQLDN